MKIEQTPLPGLVRVTPARFGDARGFFSEIWNRKQMAAQGLDYDFVQDNQSLSSQKGTVRGLHFQAPPSAQGKLVRCGRGAIFDVAVDIRVGSPTFGKWAGYTLSAENGVQMMIPAGFAHGFMTLQPESEVIYKCTDYYAPQTEGALRWDDPDIGIDWPLGDAAILSDKDADAPSLATLNSPFVWRNGA